MQDAWESDVYSYEKDRFLEYTSNEIAAKFRNLNEMAIKELKKIPSLFLYEGFTGNAKIGYITEIYKSINEIRIHFKLQTDIPEFDADIIQTHRIEFDIGK